MRLETYAKLMNKTVDWPWVQFSERVQGRINPRSKGEKLERVNKLARTLFLKHFERKYIGKEIIFENNSGEKLQYSLNYVKFESLSTLYNLHFIDPKNSLLIVGCNSSSNTPYEKRLNNSLGKDLRLKEDSIKLINEMFRYQKDYINNPKKIVF